MTFRERRTLTVVGVSMFAVGIMAGLIIAHFWQNHTPPQPAITVPTTMHFGNSGACIGTGVCNCIAGTSNDTSSIPVSFALLSLNPVKFVMSFRTNNLTVSQQAQVQYFMPPVTSYMFPVAFPLTNPNIFGGLGLPANSCIMPTSSSVLFFDTVANMLFDTITLGPTPDYTTSNVVFGSLMTAPLTPPDGGEATGGGAAGGITSISPGITSTSVPVTIVLPQANMSVLQMSFSMAALTSVLPAQATLLSGGNYVFNTTFVFPANIVTALGLQGQSPNIAANTKGTVTVNGDAVTITLPYSQQTTTTTVTTGTTGE